MNRANDNILVALIVETREAVENIESIMEVPGVDALYFGLFDLCLSMGLNPIHMPFPVIDEIVARVLSLGKRKGVAVGIGAGTPEDLQTRLAEGHTFVNYGTDYQLLGDSVRRGIETFRDLTAE